MPSINDLCPVCGGALASAGQHDAGPFCGCAIQACKVRYKQYKHECTEENAPRFLEWIKMRGGVAIWKSIDLSDPSYSVSISSGNSRGWRAIYRPWRTWWHAFLRMRPKGSPPLTTSSNLGGDQ